MAMTKTALLLIGHGTDDPDGLAEYHQLASLVQQRLDCFVQPCFLELADPPIGQALDECARAGYQRIIALPLLLGAAGHQKNDIPVALQQARLRWPDVTIHYGAPLGVQYALLKALADRLHAAEAAVPPVPRAETALALIGRGSSDPDSNADVARMARLLWEGRGYAHVMYGFYSITTPRVPETIKACVALGARRIIVIPYLLFSGRILQRIRSQVNDARSRYPDHDFVVTEHLGLHEGVIAAIQQRFQEATEGYAAVNCDVCKYRRLFPGYTADFGRPQTSDHEHGLRGATANNEMKSILPPRYRGGRPVSAAPMSAAPLVFDEQGQVAWDRIWGGDDPNNPFCELALAGGPPHRGTLLEPVDPETIRADPAGYARVIAELRRALTMVTDLPVTTDVAPGWIGLICESEEMAIWLLRAIIVENVSVRREDRTLLLPAGPQFRLDGEIKNVVTAVAKTYHYWKEHIQR
jgi:sirohydrochlorin cobaltochelatase